MELEDIYIFYKDNLNTYRNIIMDDFNDGNMNKVDYKFLMKVTTDVDGVFQDCIDGYVRLEELIELLNLSITLFEAFSKKEVSRLEFEQIIEDRLDSIYGGREE